MLLGDQNQLIDKVSYPYVENVDGNVCVVNVDLYCECGCVLMMLLLWCVGDCYYYFIKLDFRVANVLVHSCEQVVMINYVCM